MRTPATAGRRSPKAAAGHSRGDGAWVDLRSSSESRWDSRRARFDIRRRRRQFRPAGTGMVCVISSIASGCRPLKENSMPPDGTRAVGTWTASTSFQSKAFCNGSAAKAGLTRVNGMPGRPIRKQAAAARGVPRHIRKQLGRGRVAFLQILGKSHIDAVVVFLG